MNSIAASPSWRSLAIWAMPPVAYGLASDTLIGVIRAWAIARHKALNVRLADEQVTSWQCSAAWRCGYCASRSLRSRLWPGPPVGDRGMPGRPGPPGHRRAAGRPAITVSRPAVRNARRGPRDGTKTARFLALVSERHGALAAVPVTKWAPAFCQQFASAICA
jgi:hypothetical protein